MSDTPRTDAMERDWDESPTLKAATALSRTLELDLAAMTEERDKWRAAADGLAAVLQLFHRDNVCNAVHHAKRDQHALGEPCPVAVRKVESIAAYNALVKEATP